MIILQLKDSCGVRGCIAVYGPYETHWTHAVDCWYKIVVLC